MSFSKEEFWDKKILAWERRRYFSGAVPKENIRNSVEFRMHIAAMLLRNHLPGASLLDIGCGTGRFLAMCAHYGPRRLHGIDFSETAVQAAREAATDGRISFSCGNIGSIELPEADYVTGLGLLDWLSPQEISLLASKLKGRKFLLSYSEKRCSPARLAHMLFVYLTYGWKNPAYTPGYYTDTEVRRMLEPGSEGQLFFFRHPRLSFGTLVASFPLSMDGKTA